MKKLIIILLLASKVCCGQSGSIALNDSAGVILIGSDTSVSYELFNMNDIGRQTRFKGDTVITPCLILVCDTSIKSIITTTVYYFNPVGRAFQSGHNVTWIKGYNVQLKQCCVEGNTSHLAYSMMVPFYTHLYYLDDEHKRLPGSIIVWMAQ